jgi:Flp pilus assembly protein TadD
MAPLQFWQFNMSTPSEKDQAEKLHQEAMALDDAGDSDAALGKYFEALTLDPNRATTHYNIGLIYKYRG